MVAHEHAAGRHECAGPDQLLRAVPGHREGLASSRQADGFLDVPDGPFEGGHLARIRRQGVDGRGRWDDGAACVGRTPSGLLYYVTHAYEPSKPDEHRRAWDSVPGFPWLPRNG